MIVSITDYINSPKIEKKILRENLSLKIDKNSTILLVWHQQCDSKFLSNFKKLKLVIRYGVGYENIDLSYCKKNNIIVCNTPNYGVDEVSDTAISFLMSSTRKIFEFNNMLINLNKMPENWQDLKIDSIKRSSAINVCTIGLGRIGSSFIKKASSIGFKTFFYDPYKDEGYDKVLNCKKIYFLDEVFKKMDVISIHCPLTKETSGLINFKMLDKSKSNQIIINTARGQIIDFKDLEYFIKNKNMKFYLDVIDIEPPKDKKHIFFKWQKSNHLKKNIFINPHTAFYSKESFKEMRELASFNALRFIKKENLLNRIV